MSIATPIACSPDPEPLWQLTVGQYHEMIDNGILTEDDPVELLDGYLVAKTPRGPEHCYSTELARELLATLLPSGWFVQSQQPVTTSTSEPEPDVTVVRGVRRDYLTRHPGPHEVGLMIEVSESSLPRDRNLKKCVYAAAGVPVYWILNLVDRVLEVYEAPTGPSEQPDYGAARVYGAADVVPVVLEGVEVGKVQVADLLP
jgi:Uma2 family endonuclease